MINFDHLPLDKEILEALAELKINYVFQPIFEPDGKTVYAWEALMRPVEMSVTELIEKYTKMGRLHVIEVATFFGAMQEFMRRGYEEHICLNSFPSECFYPTEIRVFAEYYSNPDGRGIIEILEYPYDSEVARNLKLQATKVQDLQLALDDFGTGINGMTMVDLYAPQIIKLDRALISDIDRERVKQENVEALTETFHSCGMRIVAEGIERKEEFDYLVGLGIDYFQGYYLGMPE